MFGALRAAAAGFAATIGLLAISAFAFEPSNSSPDTSIEPIPTVAERPPADRADVPLTVAGKVGSRPVVVNPKNANQLVAAFVSNSSCYVRSSTTAGQSWNAAKKLRLPAGMQFCDAPTLFWSTDGTRVYAAYFYKANDANGRMLKGGAALTFSLDHGSTWSAPVKAIDFPDVWGPPLYSDFAYVRLFLAMPLRETDANRVYLLAEMAIQGLTGFDFTRSSNRGSTWTSRMYLGGNWAFGGDYGEAIAGGPDGQILITVGQWDFDSSPPIKNLMAIRSGNYGRTFTRSVIAANVGALATDVGFGVGGAAHVVYEQAGGDQFCCSSGIRYMYSQAPYTSWSTPVTLGGDIYNSDTTPRSPFLSVVGCGTRRSVVHVVWMSDWEGPDRYNVYYTRKVTGNHPWSGSLRISGNPVAQGDRAEPGIAAAANNAVAVWGSGLYGNPFAIWASRIAPGVTCP